MHRYCIAMALVVGVVSSGHASGWHRPACAWSSAYCYPAPVYVYPAVMPLATAPLPTMPLAVPTPAPPSQSVEPPLNRKTVKPITDKPIAAPGPAVFELRADSSAPAKDRCRVGFWNQSGRELTLVIAAKTHQVPHDRAITLEVPRTFVWQIDQQPARTEKIAADRPSHEILIR